MAPQRKRLARWLRAVFRVCRIGALLLLLALLGAFLYFNQVGLPDFLKRPIQAELRARGLDLQFERLRFRWYEGLVAEKVVVSASAQPGGPELYLGEVALRLNRRALWQRQVRLDALGIREGRFVLPLGATYEPPLSLTVDRIASDLLFRPDDRWELDRLEARVWGAHLNLQGVVSHASAFRAAAPAKEGRHSASHLALWQAQLRPWAQWGQQMRFSTPPELRFRFSGDARDPASFTASLRCLADEAHTPWGLLADLRLSAALNDPPATNGALNTTVKAHFRRAAGLQAEVREVHLTAHCVQTTTHVLPQRLAWNLAADAVRVGGFQFQGVQLSARTTPSQEVPGGWSSEVEARAGSLATPWVSSVSNQFSGKIVHSITNLLPYRAEGRVWAVQVESPQVRAASLTITGALERVAAGTPRQDAAWGAWAGLVPVELRWQAAATNLRAAGLQIDALETLGRWRAPRLELTEGQARLLGGELLVPKASVDVASRELQVEAALDFDVHRLAPVLTTNGQRWLSQFAWKQPPRASGQVRLRLPAWTNAHPDWRAEVLPTLTVQAQVQGQDAAYRGVPVTEAHTTIGYSNRVWRLPDLVIVRPEGVAECSYAVSTLTQDYHWHVRSRIDPRALRPLLDPPAQRGLDYFDFGAPPEIEADIWGRWFARERTGLAATVVLTDFAFRGESCDRLTASLVYTNLFLVVTNAAVHRGPEWATAAALGLDCTSNRLFLTNALADMEPQRIARAIGPVVSRTLMPYQFFAPVRAHVEGHVPVRGSTATAAMQFDLEGGPFHFWRFNSPDITGRVLWEGAQVRITNVVAAFYGGTLAGHLTADVRPDGDADLAFRLRVDGADLGEVLADTVNPTNRLEGTVSGELDIAHAASADWMSWQGSGQVRMQDGLLWDLPLFGILSPVLNALLPGLGNSRASAARATFAMTNSVIRTGDLEIRAAPLRLQYAGTVDFRGNVHARVEAEVLREMPLLGPLVSFALLPLRKAFEYQVTGTLSRPVTEPVYIPKFLDSLLHPLRTLKSVLPAEAPGGKPPPTPEVTP